MKKGAHEFYFANNSVVNDGPRESRFIRVNSGTRQVTIVNNVFAGHGKLLEGVGKLRNNLIVDKSDFVAPERYDYRLRSGSKAIDKGIDSGEVHGVSLRPTLPYLHPLQALPRISNRRLDLGAFEQ